MNALMSCQRTLLCKALIALLAFKRFLPRVNALMDCQTALSRKGFMTVCALIIGLHSRVHELVL